MAGPDHGQAIDRFGRVDRMAAGDRDAGAGADFGPALQDAAHHLRRDLAERHAEDGQRHDRPAAHGVDVGDGVGGGDAAEVPGVVHDRHEEVRRGDHAGVAVQPVDRRVVAGLRADQQVGEGRRDRLAGQQLLQHRRRELAPASAAMRQAGQPDFSYVHGGRPGACEELGVRSRSRAT